MVPGLALVVLTAAVGVFRWSDLFPGVEIVLGGLGEIGPASLAFFFLHRSFFTNFLIFSIFLPIQWIRSDGTHDSLHMPCKSVVRMRSVSSCLRGAGAGAGGISRSTATATPTTLALCACAWGMWACRFVCALIIT